MEPIAAWTLLAGIAVIVAIAGVIRVMVHRRGRHRDDQTHDDLQRAGESSETTAGNAAERAHGSSAWMRPDGGGF